MKNLKSSSVNFMIPVFSLFLSIKRKLNFLQFKRLGMFDKRTFSNQFEENFDFLEFNKIVIQEHCGNNLAIAFDLSCIFKSRKKTYFWSDCARKVKWRLEILKMAVIDCKNHTAFHLEALQTNKQEFIKTYSLGINFDKLSVIKIPNIDNKNYIAFSVDDLAITGSSIEFFPKDIIIVSKLTNF